MVKPFVPELMDFGFKNFIGKKAIVKVPVAMAMRLLVKVERD